MAKFNDIAGLTFGRLTATSWERVMYSNRMQILWICKCECGNTIRASSASLRRGNPKSCGCLNIEETVARSTRHGKRKSPTYSVWAGMLARCKNPKWANYRDYGGRGIKVCERWHDAALFLADMGERPTPHHSIDRIDNDGDYCPENCRWSDRIEQGRNRRSNVKLTHRDRTQTIADWSRETGISQSVLRRRHQLGWSDEQVLTRKVGERHAIVK